MRKTLLNLLLILGVTCTHVSAQCNSDDFTKACVPKLAEGYYFLKTYKIDGERGAKRKVEYSYIFTKDTQYYINLCTREVATDGIVVSLYDSERNQIVSSKIENQLVNEISFPCKSSGVYYIQYTFLNSTGYCGGSVLGFKKNQ